MANFDSNTRVSYSSLSKIEKDNNAKSHYEDEDDDDDYTHSPWDSNSPHDFVDGDGYDSSDNSSLQPHNSNNNNNNNMPPEINLKNVLNGMFAILTGRGTKVPSFTSNQHLLPTSNVSFLASAKNGDTFLNSSVYIPSAPPLLEPSGSGVNYSAYKEVLEAEPPDWLPDSSTTICMQCTAPFTTLTHGRHHCQFCRGVFCRASTKGRCLLPVKFRERDPQRVCDACYDRLDPLQGVLINSISNAVQVAKHDVIDWTCTRGWLNLPLGLSMEHEIYKASNTLRSYCQV